MRYRIVSGSMIGRFALSLREPIGDRFPSLVWEEHVRTKFPTGVINRHLQGGKGECWGSYVDVL